MRGLGEDRDAEEALGGFRRFPQWMWRNADVLDFVGWLRQHNDALPPERKIGFYGLDLYSLHGSMDAVIAYLGKLDPALAERARDRYACFEHFGGDPEQYGYTTTLGLSSSCEQEVQNQLVELRLQRDSALQRDGFAAEDESSTASRTLASSRREAYYRSMFGGSAPLELRVATCRNPGRAARALGRLFTAPKIASRLHNSHVGDARATDQGPTGRSRSGSSRPAHPARTR